MRAWKITCSKWDLDRAEIRYFYVTAMSWFSAQAQAHELVSRDFSVVSIEEIREGFLHND